MLLDPREVAEVEDATPARLTEFFRVRGIDPVEESREGSRGRAIVEATRVVPTLDLGHLGPIHLESVGGNGDNDVVEAEAMVLGHFDGGEDVGDRREAEMLEVVDELRVDASVDQVLLSCLRVEQQQKGVRCLVA